MPAKKTQEEVIALCKKIHGDRYSYDKAVYTNSKTKMIVTCNIHGDFETSPEWHAKSSGNASGCPACGHEVTGSFKRSNIATFVAKAQQVHKNAEGQPLYDYSKSEYKTSAVHILIGCKRCSSDFSQAPNHHLQGKGCPNCCRNHLRRKADDVIQEAQALHQIDKRPKYDYSSIDKAAYKGSMYKVRIKCLACNQVFEQSMNCHISQQQGCPTCSRASRSVSTQNTVKN